MTILTKTGSLSSADVLKEAGYKNFDCSVKMYKKDEKSCKTTHHRTGYVIPSAEYITLPRKRPFIHNGFAFWTLILLLFFLAFGNLILTFVVLGVLRLGHGMESLELLPEESLIKFYGKTDLDSIYKKDGKIEGFREWPMEIIGDVSSMYVSVGDGVDEIKPSIDFGLRSITIKNVDAFEVRSPRNGLSLFSSDYPSFGLPKGVEKLDVQIALTKRVASPIDDGLTIKSDTFVKVKGSEGVRMSSKEIIWSADRDIFLKSVNRSLILSGKEGVVIDVKSIPLASGIQEMSPNGQYKICVCMPTGKLFRVPVDPTEKPQRGCHTVNVSGRANPCL